MTEKKKGKFLSKTTRFGTKELTLYSLDGVTWSTRKDELQAILDRHEAERQKLLANMGEAKAQEEAEVKTEPKEERESREEEGPMIVEADADIDLDDEEAEVEEGEEDDAPKVAAKKAAEEVEAKPKPKKSTRQQKGKEKVAFVTPKPRQIAKKLKKASKSKKRAAA